MKTYNIVKSSLLALGTGLMLSSCVKFQHDDLSQANLDFEPTNAKIMSLDELYGYYPGDFDSVGQFLEIENGDTLRRDIYLNVVVIGNDVSGNIYKSMYVRDMNSERALNLSVDKTGLYNFYPVGQELYINCSGLYIGRYQSLPQLGFRYADDNGSVSLGRIPDAVFTRHVFKKGFPTLDDTEALKPIIIDSTNIDLLENLALYNQLVLLRNVQFSGDEVGQEFAPAPPAGTNPTSTNRYFSIDGKGSFVLRTSSACRFFRRPVPAGIGDMVCIYAIYGDTKQFYLRNYADLDTAQFNATGEINYPIFAASFSSDLSRFKVISIKGNARWTWGKYGDGCAMVQGSGTSKEANEDWLISDPIDIPERFTDIQFSFEQALSYKYNSDYNWYTARISTNYDPAVHSDPREADWTTLDIPNPHPGNNFTFENSGNIDLTSYKGQTFRIAFVYKSDTETMATWEVNKVKVVGNK